MSNYGSARFIVRVHLDATGQVIDIDENPREIPVQNRFSNEFRTEIDKAVRQWKFLPAELQECRKGRDINGDGKIDYAVVISTEKIPVYLDVQFEFSIVDGKGRFECDHGPLVVRVVECRYAWTGIFFVHRK